MIVDYYELPRSQADGNLHSIYFMHKECNQWTVDKTIITVPVNSESKPKSLVTYRLKDRPVEALFSIIIPDAQLLCDKLDDRRMVPS